LIELSPRPKEPPRHNSPPMPFGKYRGRRIDDICRMDPSYGFWIVGTYRIAPAIRRAFAAELGIDP
jgi:hypothetical protein